MTLQELRTDLGAKIGNPDVEDGVLNTWINEAYAKLYTEINKVNPSYFTTTTTTDLVDGTQEYSLPSDFTKAVVINVKYESDGQWYRAQPLDGVEQIPVIQRTNSEQGFSKSHPYYYLSGSKIGLMPIPDGAVTGGLYISYIPRFTDLDSTSDEPVIPAEYHWLITLDAWATFALRDEEGTLADRLEVRFRNGIDSMIEDLEDRQVQANESVQIAEHGELYDNDKVDYYHYQE